MVRQAGGLGGDVVDPRHHEGVTAAFEPTADALFVSLVAMGSDEETVTPYTYQAHHITADSPVTGEVTVTPDRARVTPGVPTDLTATWSGVPADTRSGAWIEYGNGAGTFLTLNRVPAPTGGRHTHVPPPAVAGADDDVHLVVQALLGLPDLPARPRPGGRPVASAEDGLGVG
ncbi:hypothetical protein ACF1E9_07065 [Streptomyces roseolus]|uniref:hypothetical protein n=1 Tax=Streptomyces roseolus TaxID=67358 RepID=UPI0036FDC065